MLWFAWIAFNSGATFGVSGKKISPYHQLLHLQRDSVAGKKWILVIKATITTLMSSVSGGVTGFILSININKGKSDVMMVLNGILAALVSINADCAVVCIYVQAWCLG